MVLPFFFFRQHLSLPLFVLLGFPSSLEVLGRRLTVLEEAESNTFRSNWLQLQPTEVSQDKKLWSAGGYECSEENLV